MNPLPQKHNGPLAITQEELNTLPLRFFDGNVHLVTERNTAMGIFEEIVSHEVVGFDTETRPSFYKGQHYHVALMQIAIPEKVFLIRLNQTGMVSPMISFLENDQILKAGVGLRDDIKALQKLQSFNPNGFVELSTLAKNKGLQVESVKKLAGLVLGFRISKSAQTSNWEASEYSDKQIAYAATDAWVCLELYKTLMASPLGLRS